MISIVGYPTNINPPWVFEDSGINRIGNTYFYSYCTNWSGGPLGNSKIGYMTSSSPLWPFTYRGTWFNNPGDFFGTAGNNHHTIITFKGQNYIFYHADWLNKQSYDSPLGYRTTHVDVMPVNGITLGQAKGTFLKLNNYLIIILIKLASLILWLGKVEFMFIKMDILL